VILLIQPYGAAEGDACSMLKAFLAACAAIGSRVLVAKLLITIILTIILV